MFGGCLRRVGCVVFIVIAAAAAWYWYTNMRGGAATPETAVRSVWEPVTPEGAERGRAALDALGRPGGPGFVAVSAGDVASYVFFSAANRLPESTRELQAAVIEDQLAVRGVIPLRELGAGRVLGPFAAVLAEADTVYFAGRLSVVQPEVGQYRVSELRLQQFRVPPGIVPRVLRGIDRNERPPGVSPDALALPLPAHIGDISIGGGVVILYRHTR
jgi:hypothetical protein